MWAYLTIAFDWCPRPTIIVIFIHNIQIYFVHTVCRKIPINVCIYSSYLRVPHETYLCGIINNQILINRNGTRKHAKIHKPVGKYWMGQLNRIKFNSNCLSPHIHMDNWNGETRHWIRIPSNSYCVRYKRFVVLSYPLIIFRRHLSQVILSKTFGSHTQLIRNKSGPNFSHWTITQCKRPNRHHAQYIRTKL